MTALALRLLAVTFVRTGELIGATWDEFNLDSAEWIIPAARMKMKPSMSYRYRIKQSSCGASYSQLAGIVASSFRVPEEQLEAALQQPRPSARSIAALAPERGAPQHQTASPIDVRPVLKTWGTLRDFAAALADGSMPQ